MKLVDYKKSKASWGRNQEAKTSVLVLVVVAAVLILAGLQLVISHQLATAGGQIRVLEQETRQLQAANLTLRQAMAEAGALSKVAQRAAKLGLVRNPPIVYLPSQVSVASAY